MTNTTFVNKQLKSTEDYISALQEQYSKLCVVRVDLGYKKPYSDSIVLDDANKSFNRMLNNRRSKPSVFKNQVGYICKKEYTPSRGVHFHMVFLYDGNKVQKDAYMGDKIGEYWKELTEDRGSYHNCNRKKYKNEGLGVLNHTDTEKREILDKHVISYLCKDDEEQDIEPIKHNKRSRAFTRGTLSKSKDKKKGRPRN